MSSRMTPPRKQQLLNLLRAAIHEIEMTPPVTPCSECLHFEAQTGLCVRWRQVVPDDAQDAGCGDWAEQVPF